MNEITTLRASLGMTQAQLAEHLGIGERSLRRYEAEGAPRLAELFFKVTEPLPIEDAPIFDGPQWVWAEAREGLPGFWSYAEWHPDAGWCADEIRPVTHYYPFWDR